MKKIIESININDYEILTDDGWNNIVALHKTDKYEIFKLKTASGLMLECADNHIVFSRNYIEIFVLRIRHYLKHIF